MAPVVRLPRLPKSVVTIMGPVPVLRVDNVTEDDGSPSDAFGDVHFDSRVIRVRKRMAAPKAWATLFHEQIHLHLHDAGVVLEDALEERICDVLASARVAELLASLVPHTP